MGMLINLTPYAVGELAGKDADGLPMFVAIVKASYEWQQDGSVQLGHRAVCLTSPNVLIVSSKRSKPSSTRWMSEENFCIKTPRFSWLCNFAEYLAGRRST